MPVEQLSDIPAEMDVGEKKREVTGWSAEIN
jgi:hypothetical protein